MFALLGRDECEHRARRPFLNGRKFGNILDQIVRNIAHSSQKNAVYRAQGLDVGVGTVG